MNDKWIDIKKQQPEPQQRVLVLFSETVAIAEYIPPKTVLAEDYISEDCPDFFDYDEEQDIYFAPSGFYELNVTVEMNYFLNKKIDFWQPLPEGKKHDKDKKTKG